MQRRTPMDTDATLRESKRDPFLSYLTETPMSPELHIPCFKAVLRVNSDDSVPRVMRRLTNEGFTSAPVIDDGDFVGFVDMMDLTRFVTNLFWGASEDAWIDYWDAETRFQQATVQDVMESRRALIGQPRKARYYFGDDKIYGDNSTLHALELMAMGDIHRLGVLDNRIQRRLTGIFTQSMLISEVTQRLHLLGELRYKTASQLTGFWTDVETIRDDEKAINAFNRMADQNITGLAVLDGAGVLVDAISVTDLKCVGSSGRSFSKLFQTVAEFKEFSRQKTPFVAPRAHYSARTTPDRRQPVYVTPNMTFEDIIRKMEDGNIHRVFVCSQESHSRGVPIPTHVISQTDILKQIFRHYTWSF